jgi:hypothetical protein
MDVNSMKNEEDEAFEDIERRQGGFQAKRQMAADKQKPWNEDEWRRNNWRCGHGWLRGEQCEICNAAQEPYDQTALELCEACGWKTLIPDDGCLNCERAQPAQEPINLLEVRKIAAEYGTPDSQIDSGNLYFALSKCLEHIDAQPAQEPVANCWQTSSGEFHNFSSMRAAAASEAACRRMKQTFHKLYTTPPQRLWVGLTDEEIRDCLGPEAIRIPLGWSRLTRAIEAKLKEKNT